MNVSDIIFSVGLAVVIIGSQMGRRPVTARRFLLPVLIVAVVAHSYLTGLPTAGGDLAFEATCTAAGILLGLLAAGLVRVERDSSTGKVVMQAGLAYAALWILVLGGRLAFMWASSHAWRQAVVQFSMQHAITGAEAWTTALVLMSLAMVLARTILLGARTVLVAR